MSLFKILKGCKGQSIPRSVVDAYRGDASVIEAPTRYPRELSRILAAIRSYGYPGTLGHAIAVAKQLTRYTPAPLKERPKREGKYRYFYMLKSDVVMYDKLSKEIGSVKQSAVVTAAFRRAATRPLPDRIVHTISIQGPRYTNAVQSVGAYLTPESEASLARLKEALISCGRIAVSSDAFAIALAIA